MTYTASYIPEVNSLLKIRGIMASGDVSKTLICLHLRFLHRERDLKVNLIID